MTEYTDFDISSILEGGKFSTLGKIEEIKKEGNVSYYKTKFLTVKITSYGKNGFKVDILGEEKFKGLDVPHIAPSEEAPAEYVLQSPRKGQNFRLSVKKGGVPILGTFMEYPSNTAPPLPNPENSELTEKMIADMDGINKSENELTDTIEIDEPRDMIKLNFHIPTNYGIYGLGENFTTFSKWGSSLITFPRDNFYLKANQLYKGIPFFLSDAGIGIFFPHYIPMKFDFGQTIAGLISVTIPTTRISFYVLFGSPKEIIKNYLLMTGTPQLPPEWSFGLWVSRWTTIGYKSVRRIKEILDQFDREGIPWDVLSMDPHWTSNYYVIAPSKRYVRTYACEFAWNKDYFKTENEVGDLLKEHGKRLCLNIDPYVILSGNHIKDVKDCLMTDTKGNIALMPKTDDPEMPERGMIDFTREECFHKYSEIVKDLIIRSNADSVMTDLGEIVPPDAVDSHGNPGYMIRNLIGDLYQASAYEGVKQAKGTGIVWGRSGSILKHNYPIEWGGDSVSSWEGMRTSLRAALSACMSGTIFTAFDSGGFVGSPSRLLYIRWVAMGALFSHFKIHGTTPREPWNYDIEIVNAFKELLHLRYRLLPYILKQAKISLEEKVPMIRPLILEFPDDEVCKNIDDEYLLGNDILVAPVFSEEGYRKVYLPSGKWVNFYDRSEYDGMRWIDTTVSINAIPLFVKKGAVIEMVDQPVGSNVETTLKNNKTKVIF